MIDKTYTHLTLFQVKVFLLNFFFFFNTSMKNTFIKTQKNDSNNIFYNILYKYKNIFNNNK